ncbi:RNA 2'-phosphotransferase [Microlunatus soli]|uniref:Probable RNA 2'-phosphotransferase n=1 Tax=Microlunatus soli TaxID=630515 RepID=A0A1H1MKJ3_9ACTN|nr:RNA 2'-phosphotransferase [Microlunatus soli]SDR87361.1 putative RNA 2'-phosphotransferase [Microlunatus soli]
MSTTDADLSRLVSHALRHQPWLYELELDDEGWVPIDQLIEAIREQGGVWASVDRTALQNMLATATKRRHEIDGDRIRAIYGHSIPGRIRRRPATPPSRLFHGTAPDSWSAIRSEGLIPMGRQFVHLSIDRETAVSVGRRKSADPIVLSVDSVAAAAAGVTFYEGNEVVWLADQVPAEFVAVAD